MPDRENFDVLIPLPQYRGHQTQLDIATARSRGPTGSPCTDSFYASSLWLQSETSPTSATKPTRLYVANFRIHLISMFMSNYAAGNMVSSPCPTATILSTENPLNLAICV